MASKSKLTKHSFYDTINTVKIKTKSIRKGIFMEKLTRKYGLITAICMVVGTVIGSGVFFKSQNVLAATGGNTPLGIIAWAISGLVMLVTAVQFAVMATKYEKVNGVIDYAEATCGKNYSYYMAWFLVNLYYPGMTSVLAWVSARYFGVIMGWSIVGPEVMVLAGFFLIGSYALNAFSPKLAGKFQVSATVIKLIPLTLPSKRINFVVPSVMFFTTADITLSPCISIISVCTFTSYLKISAKILYRSPVSRFDKKAFLYS